MKPISPSANTVSEPSTGTSQHPFVSDHPGDMEPAAFRAAMHRVADMLADYMEKVGDYPVVPAITPGDVRKLLPAEAPEAGEPIDQILDDYQQLIEPNTTHWNHPGFMAYFAVTGSGPGILGEALAAGLNVNSMLWRTGPAPTELEFHVCDWLRQLIGMPETFKGHINDTASISSLLALATARHRVQGLNVRQHGLAGRADLPVLVVYASEHAHSSIDKAVITLGIGLDNLRKIPADDEFRMRPDLLEQAISKDREAGRRPIAVVATVGTTSTTSVDPVREIAAICKRERVWLHVDGAYAGSAAIVPEYRALMPGIEEADSMVLNPHKWLFVPVDCSVLLTRHEALVREAFSVIPDYLKTTESNVVNLMDYGVQLGRRFRSLKFWMVMRAFGAEGLRERIRFHCRLAQEFADRVKSEPGLELSAPVPFSTVCFRAVPEVSKTEQDAFNEKLLEAVNSAGPVFISQTRLRGRLVLRMSIGNLRTSRKDLDTVWRLLVDARRQLM